MFVKPTGIMGNFNTDTLIDDRKVPEVVKPSLTTMDELNRLNGKNFSLESDEAELFRKIECACQELFDIFKGTPVASSDIVELKKRVSILENQIDKDIQNLIRKNIKSTCEDDFIDGLSEIKKLLKVDTEKLQADLLKKYLPADDPEFTLFLQLRENPVFQKAKDEALAKCRAILLGNGRFQFHNQMLLCIEDDCGIDFIADWIKDLLKDLDKGGISVKTLTYEVQHCSMYSQLIDRYLSGYALPSIVMFGTDKLHERQGIRLTTQKDRAWNCLADGIRKARKENKDLRIIPVRLGRQQSFFPPSDCSEKVMNEDLLAQFPVARKSYHRSLFELIGQFCHTEAHQQTLGEIIKDFEEAFKEGKCRL